MVLITMLITYIKISFKIFGLYLFLAVSLHSLRKRKRSAKIAKKKFFKKSSSKIWRVLEKGIIFAPLSPHKRRESKKEIIGIIKRETIKYRTGIKINLYIKNVSTSHVSLNRAKE